jgi:hypothetical protein
LFKGATSANVTFKVSSVVKGSQELKHDDDDGDWPFDSRAYPTGYAVRFTTPTPSWVLQTIRVYGCYAEDRPDAEFHVKIYDSYMNELASFTKPYMVYFKKWPTIVWAPINLADILTYNIIVTGDFYVAVSGDARSAQDGDYAFFVVLDTDWYWNGNRSYTLDMESNSIVSGPYAMTSYMMRAVGIRLVELYDFVGLDLHYWDPVAHAYVYYYYDTTLLSRDTFANVKLRVDLLETGYYWIEWRWYSPDDVVFRDVLNGHFSDGGHTWNGYDEDWISPSTNRAFFEQYLERPFRLEVYLLRSNISRAGAMLLATDTFYVTKIETQVLLSVSGSVQNGLLLHNWTYYGGYLHLTSMIENGQRAHDANGTMSIQYSTDRIEWISIYSGQTKPSTNYELSCDWMPHPGTYYLRSVWEPTYDAALYYYGNTSDLTFIVQNQSWYTFLGPVYSEFTVYPAPTSLMYDLSSHSILYGANVTITVSLLKWLESPEQWWPLGEKNVSIEYTSSAQRTEWYPLFVGTTNADGEFSFSWAPDIGVYYICCRWYGDSDFDRSSGGPSVSAPDLAVEEGRLTLVEIIKGANAEIDRASSDNIEFEVKVKDQLSGLYLNNTGTVEFYVSDQARYNIIYAGGDNDGDADGSYHLRWNASGWPNLGPQHWSAYFTGTSEYMPSLASTTLTVHQAGTEFWINPTFQTINISSSQEYIINLKWNQIGQDTFDLSISGLNMDWCTLSRTSIALSIKGKTEQVTLNVSLPDDPAIQDDYDFMITATSQTDPGFSVSANATVHIPSLHDLQGTLIGAEISFDPTVQPLNLMSKCRWLTVYIEISNDKTGNYSSSDIESSSILLNSTFGIDTNEPTQIGDYDNDTIPDLSVQFNRSRIQQFILSANVKFGNVLLNITGEFKNGTSFVGKAILKVKMPSDTNMDGKVDIRDAILASLVFGSCAGSKGWNSSCDLNEDGQINVLDLILLVIDFGKDYID